MGIVAVAARWLNTSLIRCTPLEHTSLKSLRLRSVSCAHNWGMDECW